MNPAIIIAKERLNHTTLSFVESICGIDWPGGANVMPSLCPAKIKMTATATEVVKGCSGLMNWTVKAMAIAQPLGLTHSNRPLPQI